MSPVTQTKTEEAIEAKTAEAVQGPPGITQPSSHLPKTTMTPIWTDLTDVMGDAAALPAPAVIRLYSNCMPPYPKL